MRWGENVAVERKDGILLRAGKKEKKIEEKDLEIFELMDSGVCDDDEILSRLSEQSGEDMISTGFRLAQFVEDYGDFLAEGERSKVFGA